MKADHAQSAIKRQPIGLSDLAWKLIDDAITPTGCASRGEYLEWLVLSQHFSPPEAESLWKIDVNAADNHIAVVSKMAYSKQRVGTPILKVSKKMKYYCYDCQKTITDLTTAIYSRGHWWCRKHSKLIVVDGVERVDFPSQGKLIHESIMEASDK